MSKSKNKNKVCSTCKEKVCACGDGVCSKTFCGATDAKDLPCS